MRLLMTGLGLAVLLLTSCGGTKPQSAPAADRVVDWKLRPIAEATFSSATPMSWRTVAEAEVIVRARLEIPEESIAALRAQKDDEVPMSLTVSEILKGREQTPTQIELMYYPSPRQASLTEKFIALRGADVLVALEQQPERYYARWHYLAGRDAIEPWDPDVAAAIRAEVEAQAAQADRIERMLRASVPPQDIRISQLINFLLVPKEVPSQPPQLILEPNGHGIVAVSKGFGDPLFAFDQTAIPAIVARMDDSRRLRIHSVSIVNIEPDAFEGLSHYLPGTVTDFMAILLSLLTHEDFGVLHNGAPEQQRQRTVQAWRVWLARSFGQ
jgi:hypothetical protein